MTDEGLEYKRLPTLSRAVFQLMKVYSICSGTLKTDLVGFGTARNPP